MSTSIKREYDRLSITKDIVARQNIIHQFQITGFLDRIKVIYVEAPDKSSGKRRQNIQYDGIGFIPLEELAKKETA